MLTVSQNFTFNLKSLDRNHTLKSKKLNYSELKLRSLNGFNRIFERHLIGYWIYFGELEIVQWLCVVIALSLWFMELGKFEPTKKAYLNCL